jgi:hypothetical protein
MAMRSILRWTNPAICSLQKDVNQRIDGKAVPYRGMGWVASRTEGEKLALLVRRGSNGLGGQPINQGTSFLRYSSSTMFPKILAVLLALPSLQVLAVPEKRFGAHGIHESRSTVPSQWEKRSSLDKSMIIPVRINLVQNTEGAEDLLMEVSHPESPKYGQHYDAAEVADLVRANLMRWLDLT